MKNITKLIYEEDLKGENYGQEANLFEHKFSVLYVDGKIEKLMLLQNLIYECDDIREEYFNPICYDGINNLDSKKKIEMLLSIMLNVDLENEISDKDLNDLKKQFMFFEQIIQNGFSVLSSPLNIYDEMFNDLCLEFKNAIDRASSTCLLNLKERITSVLKLNDPVNYSDDNNKEAKIIKFPNKSE